MVNRSKVQYSQADTKTGSGDAWAIVNKTGCNESAHEGKGCGALGLRVFSFGLLPGVAIWGFRVSDFREGLGFPVCHSIIQSLAIWRFRVSDFRVKGFSLLVCYGFRVSDFGVKGFRLVGLLCVGFGDLGILGQTFG